MKIQRGYKTELKPNNKQKTLLAKNAGAARFAYNWALSIKQECMKLKSKIPNALTLDHDTDKITLVQQLLIAVSN